MKRALFFAESIQSWIRAGEAAAGTMRVGGPRSEVPGGMEKAVERLRAHPMVAPPHPLHCRP